MRVLAIAVLAACGGGGGSGAAGGKAKPVGPAIDEKKAEKEAKSLASEILETLERGNKDSLFTLLDDSLIVFGPRRTDAASNRTDALVALGEVIDPKAKKKLALRSSSLDVVASSGGRSAWAFDVIDVDGEPHAITAILSNADDLWLVEAALVAHTPTRSSIKTEQGKDAVVPPGATSKAKVDPAARGAVDKFQKGLLDQAAWGADLASRTDAIVIGPGVGEVTRGKKEIKKLWKKRVEHKTRAAASGDIVAAVTKDGQLAWVTAPITMVSEKLEPLPLRAFAVFEKAGNEWTLIALHEALAVDQAGAGTAFKKTLPPAPKEPVIAAEGETKPKKKAAKEPTDDPPKKKKKKKKKPKPKDDDE